MLVLKYSKKGSARFVSHIELLRHSSRILRRAEIPVNFSNGYHPHALVFFSAPLPLGIASEAEYIAIDTQMSAADLFKRYNDNVSEDLKASKVFECTRNPNLQGRITAADYVFPTPYEGIIIPDEFNVKYLKDGVETSEDVRGKIFGCFASRAGAVLRLATGNVNLRPDRMLPAFNAMFGRDAELTDVVKTAQYYSINGEYVDADTVLERGLY